MFLQSLANVAPRHRYTQGDCWEAFRASPTKERLRPRSVDLVERLLLGDNGIAARHFATADLGPLFELSATQLNRTFEREAPLLAAEAVSVALARAGLEAGQLDALLVCTCTGYLCPGVSSFAAERLGLRPDAYLHDTVGMGCGAAIPTLRAVEGVLASQPEATVAMVAVEICSAAFYMDDDPGVLVSACLFGDGASASIWRGQGEAGQWGVCGFQTLHRPADRDFLRFEQRDGKLRNLLHRSVPEVAGRAVGELHAQAAPGPEITLLSHPGGREVLRAVGEALPGNFRPEPSAEVLRRFGNLSSPSILFAVEAAVGADPSLKHLWLTSFGAGFSAHACRWTR